MARLIYGTICSLDGYIEDEDGAFDWAEPDEEVHAFVNDLERSVGTYLYGRRTYETMVVWETDPTLAGEPGPLADYAEIWQAADKIVYSTTLTEVSTSKTRLASTFDADEVRALKSTAERDLAVSGPGLAAHAFAAGLVDDFWLLVNPIIVGGGKRALPEGVRLDLELVDERRFAGGVVYLCYRASS